MSSHHSDIEYEQLKQLHLYLQEDPSDWLPQLIHSATEAPFNLICSQDFLLLLNIESYSNQYASLMLTQEGRLYLCKETTHRLAESRFMELGYRHQYWQRFLRLCTNRCHDSFPFVYYGHAYMRLPHSDLGRRGHWLNLRACQKFTPHHEDGVPFPPLRHDKNLILDFVYQTSDTQPTSIKLSLTQNQAYIIQQIHYAYILMKAWGYYAIAEHDKAKLPHYYMHRSDYPPIFTSDIKHLKDPFEIQIKHLKEFLTFNTILTYFHYKSQPLMAQTSAYLSQFALDQDTLRESLLFYQENYPHYDKKD
ncbi:hypothetical protein [Vaginisenegalia massiliensis]|uniref:hypothetical protein n=1 Tax=Vaginisenegalia massiliensis TaxID=2058294 RepID=UPI000F53EDA8|nr:hypothetical protein [Vaginisenegalia massiliensis]